ncbi:hypothetical protein OG21DRAFT_1514412 [Imleria badia]|nr:hypothetical protein OG21DRAFT_1514412 [Imleria badia]
MGLPRGSSELVVHLLPVLLATALPSLTEQPGFSGQILSANLNGVDWELDKVVIVKRLRDQQWVDDHRQTCWVCPNFEVHACG